MSFEEIDNLLTKYNDLMQEKEKYEYDIICTGEVLKDEKLDYLTKREFLNDILFDKRKIDELDSELDEIIKYFKENNINLYKYLEEDRKTR